jgi:hypothetical protein
LTLQQIAISYEALRRYAEEKSMLDRVLAIEPNDVETKLARAFVELDWKADTQPAHQLIDEIRAKDPGASPERSVARRLASVISAESVVCHAVVPAKAGFPKVFYIFRLSFPRIPVSTSMIGVKRPLTTRNQTRPRENKGIRTQIPLFPNIFN